MTTSVLIVDDCKFTTKVLSRLMEELGFAVHAANSGEEAVAFLEMHAPPELFLVDWVMPGMSGLDFVTWLRGQNLTRQTPVLMVTAVNDISRIAEAINSGANEYIMKPFSREAIEEKLQLLSIRAGG